MLCRKVIGRTRIAERISAVDRLQMKRSIMDLMWEFLATIRSTTTLPRRDNMNTAA